MRSSVLAALLAVQSVTALTVTPARAPATFLATLPRGAHVIASVNPSAPSARRRLVTLSAGGAASASFELPVPSDGLRSAEVPTKKGSSMSTSTFNLIKNIMGAGVLSLPAGVAAFSGNPYALVPASILTILMGQLSAYCFILIARSCSMNKVDTYVESWEKAVGKKSAWIVPAATTFKTFCACLAYSIIIGDSFSSLLGAMGAPALVAARSNVIGWVTSLVLLPLCLLKSLDRLAPFSLMGIIGVLFTAGVLALRLFDGTYAPGGIFFNAISATSRPALLKGAPLMSPMVFVLISMLSTAYIAHYNAPKFYADLEDRSISKLNRVTNMSFSFCTSLFILMMSFGFLTFGKNSQGLILNNYAEQDQLAKLCRLAIGSSIMLGYPLTFIGMRDGVLNLLGIRKPSGQTQTGATLVLLSIISALALVLRDMGFVVSFGGALLGSCIIYIFPAIIFTRTVKRQIASGELQDSPEWRKEVALNNGIMGLGVVLAVIGASVSVFKTFFMK